jgi:stress-induced morphogen
MAAMEAEAIRTLLEQAFPDAVELTVEDRTGTGDHFQVIVESSDFDGLSLIDQHRRVNAALAAPLGDGSIHELRIKTKGTA